MHLSIDLGEAGISQIRDSIVSLFGKSLNKISALFKKVPWRILHLWKVWPLKPHT